jgi:hypothetical protein
MEEFSRKLIMGTFTKILQETAELVQIGQKYRDTLPEILGKRMSVTAVRNNL